MMSTHTAQYCGAFLEYRNNNATSGDTGPRTQYQVYPYGDSVDLSLRCFKSDIVAQIKSSIHLFMHCHLCSTICVHNWQVLLFLAFL